MVFCSSGHLYDPNNKDDAHFCCSWRGGQDGGCEITRALNPCLLLMVVGPLQQDNWIQMTTPQTDQWVEPLFVQLQHPRKCDLHAALLLCLYCAAALLRSMNALLW